MAPVDHLDCFIFECIICLIVFYLSRQAEIQRMRLELNRLAQERDNYKQKCDAIHRVGPHNHGQHQSQQQQQQQQAKSSGNRASNAQINDASVNYYL